ncbi:RluA family pseudouridine synthase [bacterium]|nr:RluA family pseudouridine synthase [bacterium]
MKTNNKTMTWTVPFEKSGQRLDISLAQVYTDITRSQWKRLIKDGMVRVSGQASSPSHVLKPGELVEMTIPPPEPLDIEPEKITLDILYEDDSLLVINKPAGIVVHPGAGHSRHTLVNALLYHCPDFRGIGGKKRPGIVHRLDKDTSGVLMVAKTEHAHQSLSIQLKEKKALRIYVALVHGVLSEDEGEVHTIIGRHPIHRKKMSINPRKGREASTFWKVKERFCRFTWLELHLKTGRTHQIRVHMSHVHHPVVGDTVYGRGRIPHECQSSLKKAISKLPGQSLHAQTLGFCHPETGRYMEFSTPPPIEIQRILDILREK